MRRTVSGISMSNVAATPARSSIGGSWCANLYQYIQVMLWTTSVVWKLQLYMYVCLYAWIILMYGMEIVAVFYRHWYKYYMYNHQAKEVGMHWVAKWYSSAERLSQVGHCACNFTTPALNISFHARNLLKHHCNKYIFLHRKHLCILPKALQDCRWKMFPVLKNVRRKYC